MLLAGGIKIRYFYTVDSQAGERLAVPKLIAVTYLVFVAEHYNLFTPAMVVYRGNDSGIPDNRITDYDFVSVSGQKNTVQFNSAALLGIDKFNIQAVTLFNPVLFSTCFNYSVNFKCPP